MSTARTWSQATRFVEGLQAAAGERGKAARQRDACDVEQPPRLRAGAAELRAVLQDLNEFVISLDRLGSRMADGTADEGAIGEFIVAGMSRGACRTPDASSASPWTSN